MPPTTRFSSVAGALSLMFVASDRVLEVFELDRLGRFDFRRRAVTDKGGVSAPFDRDGLALGNGGEIDVDLGHRQHRRVGVHLVDERPNGHIAEAVPTVATALVAI